MELSKSILVHELNQPGLLVNHKLDLIHDNNSFLVNITFDFSVTTARFPTSYPCVNLVISAPPEGLLMDVVVEEQGKNSPFLKKFYNQMTTI